MPFFLVQHTLGQRVQGRACLNGDVGDYEALVVQWQVTVDGLGQDSVAAVEEKDEYEDDGSDGRKL